MEVEGHWDIYISIERIHYLLRHFRSILCLFECDKINRGTKNKFISFCRTSCCRLTNNNLVTNAIHSHGLDRVFLYHFNDISIRKIEPKYKLGKSCPIKSQLFSTKKLDFLKKILNLFSQNENEQNKYTYFLVAHCDEFRQSHSG